MTALPESLATNPRLDSWVRVESDGTITVRPGKVELGQGIATALAQVAADGLGVGLDRIRMVAPSTAAGSPDEERTAGSRSVEESGEALRHVTAEVRARFLAVAAELLGTTPDALRVDDGRFLGAAGETSYAELAPAVALDVEATTAVQPPAWAPGAELGRSAPRLDLADKVRGRGGFVHNLALPGMLHARIVRPPSPFGKLLGFEDPGIPGARVVRDGSVLAVLADEEWAAVRAWQRLRASATWEPVDALPPADALATALREDSADDEVVVDTLGHVDDPAPAPLADGPATHRATYSRPFVAHASLGPSCAVAQWAQGRLTVWSPTQGVYPLRTALAVGLGVDEDVIDVHFLEGSGCYGHNGSDDASFEAALLAGHADGRPVRLQWMREDELAGAPFGPAAVTDLSATLGHDGRIRSWTTELWSYGSRGRPGRSKSGSAFWAAPQRAEPQPRARAELGGATRNIKPGYAIPSQRIVAHAVHHQPLRTSSLRSLGAHLNVFAIESFMDELAELAGTDPLAFRLRHLEDPRGRAVVELAAREAGWGMRALPPERGLGLGYARYKGSAGYCAVVAEVEATDRLRVLALTLAVDVGFVVNPDGMANQVAGGAIQALSWTTHEQVGFDRVGVTSTTWDRYPILSFTESPTVRVVHVASSEPPAGAGELSAGPTAAAVANALHAAIGVRVRTMPLDPAAILAAMDA